ncbi:MAG: cytochrome c oxidase subunit 3 [Myxococcota bacterium]|nr:cytochrome c oxidase subunit 3 [Myxococcota bacterium]
MNALIIYLLACGLVFLSRKDLGSLWTKLSLFTATFLYLSWGLNYFSAGTMALVGSAAAIGILLWATGSEKAHQAFWHPVQRVMIAPGWSKGLIVGILLIPLGVGIQVYRSAAAPAGPPSTSSNANLAPLLVAAGLEDNALTATSADTPFAAQLALVEKDPRWPLTEVVMDHHSKRSIADSQIDSTLVDALPQDGEDASWDSIAATRLDMIPADSTLDQDHAAEGEHSAEGGHHAAPEPEVPRFSVKSAYSSEGVAFLVEWSSTTDEPTGTVQAAIQLANTDENAAPPHFLMGDSENAVNAWWWQSAENTFSEFIANGMDAKTLQSDTDQGLTGSVTVEDGTYSLYMRRALETESVSDVQFSGGDYRAFALNLWTGAGDTLSHTVTGWYSVHLVPEVNQAAVVQPPFFFLATLLFLGLIVRGTRQRAEVGDLKEAELLPASTDAGLLTRLFHEGEESPHLVVDDHDDHHHDGLHWSQWPDDEDMGHATQGKIGMWLFLLSDCFSFSGLLLAYGILRAGVDVWHCTPEVIAAGIECGPIEPEYGLDFTAALTFILICSSVSMVLAIGACMENKRKEMLFWLGTTIFFGAFFLLGQVKEYWGLPGLGGVVEPIHEGFGQWLHHGLISEGLHWGESHRATTFYLITGFHGAHVTTGVCLLSWTFFKAYRGDFENADYNFMEIIGLFWHFVDLVWIIVFTVVYLIPANHGIV